MTNYSNVNARREYLKHLIDSGVEIDHSIRKSICTMFNTSPTSVLNDENFVKTGKFRYTRPPEVISTKSENIRARKKFGLSESISASEWLAVCERYSHKCAHCGKQTDLAMDHIKPLSKGGRHTIDNVQPLCKSCNSKKHNKWSE